MLSAVTWESTSVKASKASPAQNTSARTAGISLEDSVTCVVAESAILSGRYVQKKPVKAESG